MAIPITDLQIAGSGTEPIPVKLLTTSGTLSMSTITGLTFNGSSSGSTIYFSGSLTDINNALTTLTYTRTVTGTDTLEVSLVPKGEVFFTENNHLYKFISGTITANAARTAAVNQTAYGATGYLATITSQAENNFVAARLQGDGWMGGGDMATEGDWKWLSGPEAGTSFWSGTSSGGPVGNSYANWSSGEPNDYNNGNPGEDCAEFYIATGKWNDLPCTNSLSGYVVEFGAPGNLPTVTAKNISINVIENPTASTLSPGNTATNIMLNSNLVIQFSTTVSRETGAILIKKSSDDSTLETIDVAGSQVSGSGTNTITINPDTSFAESTGYYVTIPNTAFKDSHNIFYPGISTSSGWSFTTGDFTNPVVSDILSSSVASSTATITWSTNENASTKVTYGTTAMYEAATPETDVSSRVNSHTASLNNLAPCTTYHYAVVSTDSSSNTTSSLDKVFMTTGCSANSIPINTISSPITASSGGTVSLTEDNTQLIVDAPHDFTDAASSIVIQIKSLFKTEVLNLFGKPLDTDHEIGNIVFDVKAIIDSTTILDSFNTPITITYQYTDADIANIDESSLRLYHYHNGSWEVLSSCTVTLSANTISCTTESFSVFALFGKRQISSDSSQNSNISSGVSAISCGNTKPVGIPDLFQIDVDDTHAILYYSPINNDLSDYYISYSETSDTYKYGTFTGQGPSSGVLSYTVNLLQPSTTYYFKVRGQNGCMPGDWSNELKIITGSKGMEYISSYYRFVDFAQQGIKRSVRTTQILGVKDVEEVSVEKSMPTPLPSPIKPKVIPLPLQIKKKCFLWLCL